MTDNVIKKIWPTVNQIADIDPYAKTENPSKAVLGLLPYYTRGIVKFLLLLVVPFPQ